MAEESLQLYSSICIEVGKCKAVSTLVDRQLSVPTLQCTLQYSEPQYISIWTQLPDVYSSRRLNFSALQTVSHLAFQEVSL